jgi:Flp pilus assembly protein TadG
MTARRQTFGAKLDPGERGSTAVLVAIFVLVLFGFAALSLDVSRVYIEKHKEHMATDAAALAGVAKVGDPAVSTNQQASAAITEADAIANANGVTDAEIAAAPTNRYPARIQVGWWANGTFTASAPPYNAVRVPAKRTVPIYFGKAVGTSRMSPAVDSIATIGMRVVPYGIPSCVVTNVGGTNTLQNWKNAGCSSSAGNWGAIDLCGALGPNDVASAISGPGCYSSVGQVTTTRTGVPNKTSDGFQTLWDNGRRIIVLPVTSDFPTGNSGDITVLDYVVVQLLGPPTNGSNGNGKNGNGNNNGNGNWGVDVQILGRGYGALRQFGLGPTRNLVE